MQDFGQFGLPNQLITSLSELNFTNPTPIQAKVIPVALGGKDILGSAQTGTGKTGAFGIPLIAKLLNNEVGTGIVITPTRELAVQVMNMLKSFLSKKSNIKTALLIGGESVLKQFHQLRHNPRLIVGTPGRINDHLIRGTLDLSRANFLVLDETDRMLDMGFSPQIDQILKFLPENRQTLLFSATLPKNIVAMSNRYLSDPVRISTGFDSKPAENIKQELLYLSQSEKEQHLKDQLDKREGSIIVFVETKRAAEKLASQLRLNQHSADAMHGDLDHRKRKVKIDSFRDNKYRIMVATDIAARGLDIPHVKHVINYDLPRCPEDYIHRIGRTARAGAEGSAICFITPGDKSKWRAINYLMNPELADKEKGGEKIVKFKPRGNNGPRSNNGFGKKKKSSAFSFKKPKKRAKFA